jgi:L-ascorbate metabolism protein UlaG (beta-lactamase superfamily)
MVFANHLRITVDYIKHKGRFMVQSHDRTAGFKDILKWQANGSRVKWPRDLPNKIYAPPNLREYGDGLVVTWIGHSTVLIQTAGVNILTDPFFSRRASPLSFAGPSRVRAPGIALSDLPPIDVVLLSHNHYDHMDLPSLRALSKNHKAALLTPLGNQRHLHSVGPGLEISELDWRQSLTLHHVKFTAMPARHWSKRSLRDSNKSLWCAFVIEAAGGIIYFAGDTGYGDGGTFREILEAFGPPRLSLLPIGAYEPRWFMKPQHMNPDEAVQAHVDLNSMASLAIHHGTLQLTDEAIDAPIRALAEARHNRKISSDAFFVLDIGESRKIG